MSKITIKFSNRDAEDVEEIIAMVQEKRDYDFSFRMREGSAEINTNFQDKDLITELEHDLQMEFDDCELNAEVR